MSRRSTSTATPTARTPRRYSPSVTQGARGPWWSTALRAAWQAVCDRAGRCPGILGSIRGLADRLARHPIVGTGTDADGVRRHVRLGPVELGDLVYDATYTYTVFRDLPGALAALHRGDRAPILRLAAEDVAFNLPGGSPSSYSNGDYLAVACHDYPTIWAKGDPPARRRATLASAIRHLSPNVLAPFSKRVWLRTVAERELIRGCLDWPRPRLGPPPFPGSGRPAMPVLVLNGELDQSTPVADAQHVASAFPNATLVEVPNTAHVSALYDFQHCASHIVRKFLRTLATGSTACAAAMPPVNVAAFPRTLAAAPEADGGGRVGLQARRAGWVATETIGDALARWYNLMFTPRGHGLQGGGYTITGEYLSHSPLSIRFERTRLTSDMAVSGRAVWDRRAGRVHARLRLTGAARGVLTISFPTDVAGAIATISGRVNGRTVRLQTAAPWAPQG